MDTKLKNYKMNKTTFSVFAAFDTIAIFLTCLAATVAASLSKMVWVDGLSDEERSYMDLWFDGKIASTHGFEIAQNVAVIGGVIFLIISIALTVLLILNVGGERDENGKIQLIWFDKIWSDVQLCTFFATGGLSALVFQLLYGACFNGPFSKIWDNLGTTYSYNDVMTPEAQVAVGFIGLLAAVFIMLANLLSLVKKLKAKELWNRSLIGICINHLIKWINESDATLVKLLLILICGTFLATTALGTFIVIVAIFAIVPRQVRKFNEVRKGAEEVKNGNLTYKIPVESSARKSKNELDRLAEDINEISHASNIAVQNELKNQRLKTELISNVSHDIKTPLTSMVTYADLLKTEGLESPNAPDYLDIVDQKTQRLRELTENLFEAAKASSGAMPMELESIDINALLSQSLVEFDDKFEAKGLSVQIQDKCEDESVRVIADGKLFHRVIENVLGNISKYAMDNSRVYIDINELKTNNKDSKDMVSLEIKNISKDPLNLSASELMERFKRGDESRNTEGSGLGLSIAKDLTKMMNGVFEIRIDGDLFKISILMEKAEEKVAD